MDSLWRRSIVRKIVDFLVDWRSKSFADTGPRIFTANKEPIPVIITVRNFRLFLSTLFYFLVFLSSFSTASFPFLNSPVNRPNPLAISDILSPPKKIITTATSITTTSGSPSPNILFVYCFLISFVKEEKYDRDHHQNYHC